MNAPATKNVDAPDEVRQMKDGKGRLELVDLGSGLIARAWRTTRRTEAPDL